MSADSGLCIEMHTADGLSLSLDTPKPRKARGENHGAIAPAMARLYASVMLLKTLSASTRWLGGHRSGWCSRHSFRYAAFTCDTGTSIQGVVTYRTASYAS